MGLGVSSKQLSTGKCCASGDKGPSVQNSASLGPPHPQQPLCSGVRSEQQLVWLHAPHPRVSSPAAIAHWGAITSVLCHLLTGH